MRFIVSCVLWLICLGASARHNDYKIVDLNVRYDNPNDFPNHWDSRKSGVIQWLKRQNADIYFFQEVLHHQLLDISSGLSYCMFYGIGREDGATKGEYSPIFFNQQKFQMLSSETFWLSETPHQPSKGWDAACERIVTHVVLIDKESKDTLDLFNTHWDHIGKEAQMESAVLINNLIHSISPHHLLVCGGDFNTDIHSEPIQFLITSNALVPSGELSIWETNTYHGFGKVETGKCIDFIFYNQFQFESDQTYTTRHFRKNWFSKGFLSDHDAIVTQLKIIRNRTKSERDTIEFRF